MRMRRLIPALLLVFCSPLFAAPEAPSLGDGMAGQIVQMGFGLLLVVGLIFLLGYLMRRVGPLAPQGGQHIRVISTYPLGPRDRLALVEVGDQQLLLGISPGRITTLHVMDEPVIADRDPVSSDFTRKLAAILKKEQKP